VLSKLQNASKENLVTLKSFQLHYKFPTKDNVTCNIVEASSSSSISSSTSIKHHPSYRSYITYIIDDLPPYTSSSLKSNHPTRALRFCPALPTFDPILTAHGVTETFEVFTVLGGEKTVRPSKM